jgi:hypothetical protein
MLKFRMSKGAPTPSIPTGLLQSSSVPPTNDRTSPTIKPQALPCKSPLIVFPSDILSPELPTVSCNNNEPKGTLLEVPCDISDRLAYLHVYSKQVPTSAGRNNTHYRYSRLTIVLRLPRHRWQTLMLSEAVKWQTLCIMGRTSHYSDDTATTSAALSPLSQPSLVRQMKSSASFAYGHAAPSAYLSGYLNAALNDCFTPVKLSPMISAVSASLHKPYEICCKSETRRQGNILMSPRSFFFTSHLFLFHLHRIFQ